MTIETISDGLRRLGDIYGTIEEVICLPSNQVCPSEQKKMLEGTECTPVLLDLCSAMLEDFAELKATIQDLQVALRKADATLSIKIQLFTSLSIGVNIVPLVQATRNAKMISPHQCIPKGKPSYLQGRAVAGAGVQH